MINSPSLGIGPLTHPLALPWDETCRLLGGATWIDSCRGWASSCSSPESMDSLAQLAERFSSRRQFFFSSQSQPPWPLEVFWLQWRLLTSLARHLFDYHATHHTPFLGLGPSRVSVEFPPGDDPTLPPRWSFFTSLSTQACALPYVPPSPNPMPPNFSSALFQPPPGTDHSFTHPSIQVANLGHQESGTALIRSMEAMPPKTTHPGVTQGLLTIHFLSDALSSKTFSHNDVFFIRLPPPPGSSHPLEMWATPTDTPERGLMLLGTCDPLATPVWERFHHAQREAFPQTLVTIYPSFHIPCDLYSLGMMIFYALIGHGPERWHHVTQVLPSLLASLEHVIHSAEAADHFGLGYALRRRLTEEGSIFSKKEVSSGPGTPSSTLGSIPDDLWDEALVIAFKLISHIPGFSFCSHRGDFDPQHPDHPMERVMHDMDSLGEGIRLELFGATPRNREILDACKLVRRELFPQEAPTPS